MNSFRIFLVLMSASFLLLSPSFCFAATDSGEKGTSVEHQETLPASGEVNVHLESMLRSTGELSPSSIAFLRKHRKEILAWGETRLGQVGLLKVSDQSKSTNYARLIKVLLVSDPKQGEVYASAAFDRVLNTVYATKSSQRTPIIIAFLSSSDPWLNTQGVFASAQSDPKLLIEALQNNKVIHPQIAMHLFGKFRIKQALPFLTKVAKHSKDQGDREHAELVIMKIQGDHPDENIKKDSPQEMASAYVKLVKQSPEWWADNEVEFYLIPTSAAKKLWVTTLASQRGTKKAKSELVERAKMVDDLTKALANADKAFKIQNNECSVVINNETVLIIYKDMFAQWRLMKNP